MNNATCFIGVYRVYDDYKIINNNNKNSNNNIVVTIFRIVFGND